MAIFAEVTENERIIGAAQYTSTARYDASDSRSMISIW